MDWIYSMDLHLFFFQRIFMAAWVKRNNNERILSLRLSALSFSRNPFSWRDSLSFHHIPFFVRLVESVTAYLRTCCCRTFNWIENKNKNKSSIFFFGKSLSQFSSKNVHHAISHNLAFSVQQITSTQAICRWTILCNSFQWNENIIIANLIANRDEIRLRLSTCK